MKKKCITLLISCILLSQLTYAENKTTENISPDAIAPSNQSAIEKPEDKKVFIQNKINNILNKKVYVNVTTPEEYIANLDTTDFVKGLLLESVVLSNTIAENKDNEDKLDSIAQDVINNTACQQVIMKEESLLHYQRLMNLLFKTPEQRANFLAGQKNLEKHMQNINFDGDFIEYCKKQTY
jgi:hypothetical protein